MSKEIQQKTDLSIGMSETVVPVKKFYTKYDRLKTGSDTIIKGQNVKFSSMVFTKPTKTEQQFAYETNINNIVKGAISNLPPNYSQPHYGYFPSPNAYVESLNLIAQAKSTFEQLPSSLRERFGNNPENLLKFMSDENNKAEAIALGIIASEVQEEIKESVTTEQVAE